MKNKSRCGGRSDCCGGCIDWKQVALKCSVENSNTTISKAYALHISTISPKNVNLKCHLYRPLSSVIFPQHIRP